MSAVMQSGAVSAPHNFFNANISLPNGVEVRINAPTLADLSTVVGKLQPTEAANDTGKPAKPAAAAKATAGASASPTAAPSAQTAAAPAAQGEAGNAAQAAGPSAAVSPASSSAQGASGEVTFEQVKKAFLALSTKADGRAKCEAVLATVDPKPARLSEAKPEQYPALLKAIEEASK